MLTDDEWISLHEKVDGYIDQLKANAPAGDDDADLRLIRPRIAKLLEEYNSLTGEREGNVNAVWHHRRSLYGPPCCHCGVALRTSEAKFCFLCHRPQAYGSTSIPADDT